MHSLLREAVDQVTEIQLKLNKALQICRQEQSFSGNAFVQTAWYVFS